MIAAVNGTAPSDLRTQWETLRIRINPDVSPEEAARLQLEVLMFASEITWPVNQARLEEKRAAAEARREFTDAFILSSESSDRKREAVAKSTTAVRIAEAKFDSAEAYRKLLEDLRDDVKMAHYALRAVAKIVTEDRFLN